MFKPVSLLMVMAVSLALALPVSAMADTLARWKGGELMRADYEHWRQWVQREESDEAVYEMIFMLSLANAARAHGAADDATVQLKIAAARQQLLTPALKRYSDAQASVTDASIDQLMQQYPNAFQRPRKLLLRNLFKYLPDDAGQAEAVRQRMQALHRQLLAGADFTALLRTESESQTRFRDGRLGVLDPASLPPPVAAAVGELAPGAISQIVEHGGGLSIFFCEKVTPAHIPSVQEVRHKFRTNSLNLQKKQRWQQLDEQLLAQVQLQPANPAVVLQAPDYQLDRAGLEALLALRTGDQAGAGRAQREVLLRNWALGIMRDREAVKLGLDREPAIAAALRWQPWQILAQTELTRLIDKQLSEPSEAELRQFFQQQPDRYRQKHQYLIAAIHFGPIEQVADQTLLKRARTALEQLETGAQDFTQLARQYSVHPSARQGGLLGWQSRAQIGSWDIALLKAIRQLQPGQHSGLFRLPSGLWLFQLQDYRAEYQPGFAEVHTRLRQDWRQQQIDRLEAVLRRQHLAALDIEILTQARAAKQPPVRSPQKHLDGKTHSRS